MSRSSHNQPSRAFASHSGHRRSRAGFTIVELLVAAAITLVVLGLMIQVTFTVLGTFGKVSGTLTARAEATTVLNYLRNDLQSIVWRRDSNVWLLATIQNDQDAPLGRGETNITTARWTPPTNGNVKPGQGSAADFGEEHSSLRLEKPDDTRKWTDLTNYRFGQAGVWLRFFTNQLTDIADDENFKDFAPIAVAYQIVRIKPIGDLGDSYRYQFYRSVVRSGPRGTSANDSRSVARSGFNLTASDYNDNAATSTHELPLSIRKPDIEVLIANNVIDFGVRFWSRNPTTGALTLIFPAEPGTGLPDNRNRGFAATSSDPANITPTGALGIPFAGLSNNAFNTGFPDFADVFVRVLTDEGARLIEAFENGNLVATSSTAGAPSADDRRAFWWKIAEENSEVFTERIPINARPL